MKEIPLTRGLVAIVDDEDYAEFSKFKWFAHKSGYAVRKVPHPSKPRKGALIWMHRSIFNLPLGDKREVDHFDGNRLNNMRSNLRVCNRSQNSCNRGANKNNTSGFKGVYWKEDHRKWFSCITVNRKRMYLGYFDSPEMAHAAYCAAANEFHGEFANHG